MLARNLISHSSVTVTYRPRIRRASADVPKQSAFDCVSRAGQPTGSFGRRFAGGSSASALGAGRASGVPHVAPLGNQEAASTAFLRVAAGRRDLR